MMARASETFSTADIRRAIGIVTAIAGLGFLINATVLVVRAHPAPLQVTYDNDGRQFARVAPTKTAHHRGRAGRVHRAAGHRKPARSVSLAGVVPELAIKTRAIVADCGSVVVSAVAKRGNRSNHPLGRAVDLRGNPACIYARLEAWPGGVSTDYWTAPGGPHVHVSYNPHGQEWGLRFAHRHPGKQTRTRYAHVNRQEARY